MTEVTAMVIKTFEDHVVRSFLVDDQPYFVGKDIAVALGYRDPQDAIKSKCEGVRRAGEIVNDLMPRLPAGSNEINDLHSLDPKTGLIPEGDVYRLIAQSTLPNAKRFQVWLYDEVLPTLRKTGHYTLPSAETTQTHVALYELFQAELDYIKRLVLDQINSIKSDITRLPNQIKSEFNADVNRLLQYKSIGDKKYSPDDVVDYINKYYAPPGTALTKSDLRDYLINIRMIKKNNSPMVPFVNKEYILVIKDPFKRIPDQIAFSKSGVEYIIESMISDGFIVI